MEKGVTEPSFGSRAEARALSESPIIDGKLTMLAMSWLVWEETFAEFTCRGMVS